MNGITVIVMTKVLLSNSITKFKLFFLPNYLLYGDYSLTSCKDIINKQDFMSEEQISWFIKKCI